MKKSRKSDAFREILVTGGAGFIGAHLVREIQRRWPDARLTVVDDFRSGDFKNLAGYRGDLVAMELAGYSGGPSFDHIFHLASITDTTVHDQRRMVHDNVEGFRNVLKLAAASKARVVYASSAATYGQGSERMGEDAPPKPANVYAFSKVVLDNLAEAGRHEGLRVTGLRYFNVYGPGEAHKGEAASMITQLYRQMKAGKRPRIFKHGEQKRDFVHVADVVTATLLAAEKGKETVYNVGSGAARSFNDVIKSLNASLRTDLKPEYFDNPYPFYQEFTEADITRAREDLGYAPAFELLKGVADTVRRIEG
jgi:ADP-L-glycero-D-manno-heptose 6-epimerase